MVRELTLSDILKSILRIKGGSLLRITCSAGTQIGYIYLMPPEWIGGGEPENKVEQYIDKDLLQIPVIEDGLILNELDKLIIMDKTYKQALKNGDFDEEYCNDLDDQGYMKGVELNISKEVYLRLIQKQAYKIYKIHWRNQNFLLLTLDGYREVINPFNRVYPLTKREDVFVIVRIESRSEYNVVFIKGLISSSNDLYPLDYLETPNFELWE